MGLESLNGGFVGSRSFVGDSDYRDGSFTTPAAPSPMALLAHCFDFWKTVHPLPQPPDHREHKGRHDVHTCLTTNLGIRCLWLVDRRNVKAYWPKAILHRRPRQTTASSETSC